jgi:hypothetical protein
MQADKIALPSEARKGAKKANETPDEIIFLPERIR